MIGFHQVHESKIAPLVRLIVRTNGITYFWKLEYLTTESQVEGFSFDVEGQQTLNGATASAKIYYRRRIYFQKVLKRLGKAKR